MNLAPEIFSIIFGNDWREAGVYASKMTPLFWSIFVFEEIPDYFSWIGIILITCSGLYVAFYENTKWKKKDIYIPIPRNR